MSETESTQSVPPPPPNTLLKGSLIFDRFHLERKLGKGGMGEVWLAWDPRLQRHVALKFLIGAVAHDAGMLEELRREILRGLEVTHPCMVRVYDLHETADRDLAAIAMEYVGGRSLKEEKEAQPGKCFEVAEPFTGWVRQLCEALTHLHEDAKLIHRDLKPGNLMLTTAGRLKVADFGISATVRDHTASQSRHYGSSGTPAYMSPQQADGERPTVSDDVYALGATLYDLLTSKPPFFRGNITDQVKGKVPPAVQARRAELELVGRLTVPAAWEIVIAACLAKDPAARPRSAREVAVKLGLLSPPAPLPKGAPVQPKVLPPKLLQPKLPQPKPPQPKMPLPVVPRPSPTPSRGNRAVFWWVLAGLLVSGAFVWWARLGRVPSPVAAEPTPVWATQEVPFTNSLGMRFVPVPGTEVLFSAWETRVQDYAAFAQATGRGVLQPGFDQAPTHSALNVSWEDAQAFCAWLSQKEGHTYRLPTDAEWSVAAGLSTEQGATPSEKSGQAEGYPWGTAWPPPPGAGNFADATAEEASRGYGYTHGIEDYHDGYCFTSPAGSFTPHRFGLYDLSGNVWEWCQDWSNAAKVRRVLRGGSWAHRVPGGVHQDDSIQSSLRSSYRSGDQPTHRNIDCGFRCVVVAGKDSSPQGFAAPPSLPVAQPTPVKNTLVPPSTLGLVTQEPLRNSLGMRFVPVPGAGVLFSVWETRVQDYAVFAQATGREVEKPGWPQGPTHPAVNISWEDAQAFCLWLSQKEGRTYRLPTDAEWSLAAGSGTEPNFTPEQRQGARGYPWGAVWPPPPQAGNFTDASSERVEKGLSYIPGYHDGYDYTSPVGTFTPNQYGLYDLSGNVEEWCQDWYNAAQEKRVLRGGSWLDMDEHRLRSSFRGNVEVTYRGNTQGFRCVVVSETIAVSGVTSNPSLTAQATGAASFENSLEMRFVPVPTSDMLFSVWETRVQDYAAFARATSRKVETPNFEQGPTHPVVMVNWEDAQAFCLWLSQKEGRTYRLPTDAEWSLAAGLGTELGKTPEEKKDQVAGYSWGATWPPPPQAGNFGFIEGFVDGYKYTSPVGTFTPNQYGLYDLEGNVWEWCQDWYNAEQTYRVLRGSSWFTSGQRSSFLSPRGSSYPSERDIERGFRCVVTRSGK